MADTFRRDHLGAYGNDYIRTPTLDGLARGGTLFERHCAGGFPTMPTRADHATGRWTMSFMGWEPLPEDAVTLAEILSAKGCRAAAMVDTPFYVRGGMNYDSADPGQANNLIGKRESDARELHRLLIRFMEETGAARGLIGSPAQVAALAGKPRAAGGCRRACEKIQSSMKYRRTPDREREKIIAIPAFPRHSREVGNPEVRGHRFIRRGRGTPTRPI